MYAGFIAGPGLPILHPAHYAASHGLRVYYLLFQIYIK